MKTYTQALLFAVLTTSLFFSCKKDDGDDPGTSNTAAGYAVDISYAANNQEVVLWAAQPDKKIISASSTALLRLNADGSTDNSCQADPMISNANFIVSAVAVQLDGKVLVAGTPSTGDNTIAVYRLNPNGSIDNGFSSPAFSAKNNIIHAILTLPNGDIMVGGAFEYRVNGKYYYNIARLQSDGTLGSEFLSSISITAYVSALAHSMDGKVILSGRFSGNIGPGVTNGFLKVDSRTGVIDTDFRLPVKLWARINNISGAEYEAGAKHIMPQQDGSYLIVGDFYSMGPTATTGTSYPGIARLNDDGTEDKSFIPDVASVGAACLVCR